MSTFNWLHLTDLHWGQRGLAARSASISEQLHLKLSESFGRERPCDAVLFTGDLVFSGTRAEFDDFDSRFLNPLMDLLTKRNGGVRPVLFVVPGNHDLQRPKCESGSPLEGAEEALCTPDSYEQIERKIWGDKRGQYHQVIEQAFHEYVEWVKRCKWIPNDKSNATAKMPGDFTATMKTRGGKTVGIVGLNSTFLQLSGEHTYEEKLAIRAEQLAAVTPGQNYATWCRSHDACLLLTHQGPDWFRRAALDDYQTEINPGGRFALHLFGHMHEKAVRVHWNSPGCPADQRWIWQGASIFGLEKFMQKGVEADRRHGFGIGTIDFGGKYPTWRYSPFKGVRSTTGWSFEVDSGIPKLKTDGGTYPQEIRRQGDSELDDAANESASPSPASPAQEPIESLVGRIVPQFQQQRQAAWNARWAPESREVSSDSPADKSRAN